MSREQQRAACKSVAETSRDLAPGFKQYQEFTDKAAKDTKEYI
jgi:hypothetical protein